MAEVVELTVAQAMVRFLSAQYSESDGVEQRLFAGCFGVVPVSETSTLASTRDARVTYEQHKATQKNYL